MGFSRWLFCLAVIGVVGFGVYYAAFALSHWWNSPSASAAYERGYEEGADMICDRLQVLYPAVHEAMRRDRYC